MRRNLLQHALISDSRPIVRWIRQRRWNARRWNAGARMSSIQFEPSLAQTQRQSGRIQWVNIAKGIGIILVVFGHVGRGVIDRDNATAKQGITATLAVIHQYVSLDNALYAFHMALFFFLSGLFVERGPKNRAFNFLGKNCARSSIRILSGRSFNPFLSNSPARMPGASYPPAMSSENFPGRPTRNFGSYTC